MKQRGMLDVDLVLALRDWEKGLREGEFGASARSEKEAVIRTERIMRGLDDPRQLAENWVLGNKQELKDTEAGLRARLSDEMAYCLRKGGVIIPETGEVRQDLPVVVETAIYQLQPELKNEVDREVNLNKEGGGRPLLEGSV